MFLKAARDDKITESIFKNMAILQKNILDIDLDQRLKTPVDPVIKKKYHNSRTVF